MASPHGDRPIYLDYNGTTPIDPRVADAMAPYLTGGLRASHFGNPSSAHAYGPEPKAALARARAQCASLLRVGDDPRCILFESGGTESINHIVKGVTLAAWRARPAPAPHIITTAIEHVAVLDAVAWCVDMGFATRTIVPVDRVGRIAVADVVASLREETCLVSCMLANNETGVMQPVADLAAAVTAAAHAHGWRAPVLHSDVSQCVGKVPVHVDALGVDVVTLAGHKLYAPKGVGLTAIASQALDRIPKFMHGGGQEMGARAGTENVAFAVGLGTACALAQDTLATEPARLHRLRTRLVTMLRRLSAAHGLPPPVVHGPAQEEGEVLPAADGTTHWPVLPNTLSIAFPGTFAARLVASCSATVAISAGAACHASAPGDVSQAQPSHVLAAMHVPTHLALATVRMTLGRWSTDSDVIAAATMVMNVVARVRPLTAPALSVIAARDEGKCDEVGGNTGSDGCDPHDTVKVLGGGDHTTTAQAVTVSDTLRRDASTATVAPAMSQHPTATADSAPAPAPAPAPAAEAVASEATAGDVDGGSEVAGSVAPGAGDAAQAAETEWAGHSVASEMPHATATKVCAGEVDAGMPRTATPEGVTPPSQVALLAVAPHHPGAAGGAGASTIDDGRCEVTPARVPHAPLPTDAASLATVVSRLALEARYLNDTYTFSVKTEALAVVEVPTHVVNGAGSGKTVAWSDVVWLNGDLSVPTAAVPAWAAVAVPAGCAMAPAVPGCPAALLLRHGVVHPQGGGQPSDVGIVKWEEPMPHGSGMLLFHFAQSRALAPITDGDGTPVAGVQGGVLLYGRFMAMDARFAPHSALDVDAWNRVGTVATPVPVAAAVAAMQPTVTCIIARDHRVMSARLHSGGHLLDAAVKAALSTLNGELGDGTARLALTPGKGYHFQDGPFVEYEGTLPAAVVPRFTALVQQGVHALTTGGLDTQVQAVPNTPADLTAAGLAADAASHLPAGSPVRVVRVAGNDNPCPCGGTHVASSAELSGLVVGKVTSKKGKTKVAYTMPT